MEQTEVYKHKSSEDLQEIFDAVVEKTGESEKTVRKVLYNAANYIRIALQEPERPEVRWSGLLCWRLNEKRLKRYLEKIESRADNPRPSDAKDLVYYKSLLDMVNKYKNGSWKKN